jgi:hypothetical protein
MPYCHDCDEGFEVGTILCPDCGSKLAEEGGNTESGAEWSSDDSERDETSWTDADSTGGDTGWSNNESASAEANTGWSSGESAAESTTSTIRDDPVSSADATDQLASRRHGTDLFDFSFRFPLGKGGKPLLIDSVVVFFGTFLLIPLLFAGGYAYRVGRAAARGDEEPPSFDDWGGLGRDGLLLGAIFIGNAIVVSLVLGVISFAGFAVRDTSALVLLFAGIGFLVLVAMSYVAGAIVPVLIGTGSVGKTFSDGRLLDFALSFHYLKGVLAYVAFSIILSIAINVVTFLLSITIIGLVLVVPLVFVVMAYQINLLFAMWGYIYNEAAIAGDVEPVASDASLGLE